MNIRLLVHGPPALHPDLLAEVKQSVRERRSDRRERETV